MTNLKQLVFEMLTENTGTHMCDSGGSSGRMWQKNQNLTINDFEKRPEAVLELSVWGDDDRIDAIPTIDVFHYLNNSLELDAICDEFNSMSVDDWNSDEFYGVSNQGEIFILDHFQVENSSWNSYNWDNSFSQVMQGREVENINTGERYVVLQIHGGADVRGGYTDAKLFKISDNCDYFLDDMCYFDIVDWSGEFLNHEGSCATDNDWLELKEKYKVSKDNTVILEGSIG